MAVVGGAKFFFAFGASSRCILRPFVLSSYSVSCHHNLCSVKAAFTVLPGHESRQGIVINLRLNKAILLLLAKFNVSLRGSFAEMAFAVFALHISRAGTC